MAKSKIIQIIQRNIASKGYCDVYRSMGTFVKPTREQIAARAAGSEDGKSENKYRFRLTDETKDSHETIFKTDKWRMDSYNGVVTAQHPWLGDTDTKLFIGKSTLERVGDAYYADLTLQEGPANTTARDIEEKLDQGIFNSASVYARVYDGSYGDAKAGEDPETFYFRDQELITWGVVAFPSNQNAVRVMPAPGEKDDDTEEEDEDDTTHEEEEKQREIELMEDEIRLIKSRSR